MSLTAIKMLKSLLYNKCILNSEHSTPNSHPDYKSPQITLKMENFNI